MIDVAELQQQLEANARRRELAERELRAARDEFDELAARAASTPMRTADVALVGRVARETVYQSRRRFYARTGL